MAHVIVRNLDIVYKNRDETEFVAVSDVNFEVEQGEFITIVGPSGCGKSTLLNAMHGLLTPARGEIIIGGQKVDRPSQDRAMVFQEFALMPWRTIEENIWFGLELQGKKKEELQEAAEKYLKLTGLKQFSKHYPHQLSGGMRQRVGIARALAINPDILLMDEPFGALDAQTREIMQSELLRIWETDRKTVFFVTHGIDEAIYLADRIMVMTARPGRIKEIITVDLPRPRGLDVKETTEFGRIRHLLWELLHNEVTASVSWD